jgi:putative hemolysin
LLSDVLIVLVLILVNGIFSGAEIAILSLRKTRLAELVAAGKPGARSVTELRANPEGFLATVQIGITVVGATAAAFGGSSMAADIAPAFAAIPGVNATLAHDLALATVVAIVSVLSLVLGELVPKSLALRASETYALLVGGPLKSLAWAARPLVAFLTGASNIVLRAFGDRTTFREARLSKEEIQQIVEEASTIGSLDPHAGEIASRALDFSGRDAYTIMVAASAIAMLEKHADVRTVAELALKHRHARMPVYEGSPDHVIGFANVRDFLATAVIDPSARLEDHIHPVVFIPDSMPAPDVLRRLQENRTHVGIVLDEQGTTLGLVTIEDLVEELVGDILSEDDPTPTGVLPTPEGLWVMSGDTPLHVIERALDIELPKGDYATIAGLCLQLAGRIPEPGARFRVDDLVELEVIEATPRRVRRVRIHPLWAGAPPAG